MGDQPTALLGQGIHKGNERKLGDCGFEVDSSTGGGSKPTPPSP